MKPKHSHGYKATNKESMIKKAIVINERERSMFDEAINLGVRDINYYLPNKQTDEVKVENGGV